MLTTTILACKCPVIIAPAMNTNMYENPIVSANIKRLESYGFKIISPAGGRLACGDSGIGKLPEPEFLLEHIVYEAGFKKDLSGKRVLVTAGPTKEAIDPVRFISNHSTERMRIELTRAASQRGAEVTLVLGSTDLKPPIEG